MVLWVLDPARSWVPANRIGRTVLPAAMKPMASTASSILQLVAALAVVRQVLGSNRYAPESNVIAKGALKTHAIGAEPVKHPLCVDSLGMTADGSTIGVYDCHGQGGNQAFLYTTDHQIRLQLVEAAEQADHEMVVDAHECVDAASPPEDPKQVPRAVKLWPCHGQGGNQQWHHLLDGTIRHIEEDAEQCLETYELEGGDVAVGLRVNTCDGSLGQQWHWLPIRKPKLHTEL